MKFLKTGIVICIYLFLFPLVLNAKESKGPLEILKDAIDITQNVIKSLPENFSQKQENEAKEKIRGELEPLLDQDKVSELSISSQNWLKFSPQQKIEYKENLKKILIHKFSALYEKEKKSSQKNDNLQKLRKITIDIKTEKQYNDKLLKVPEAVKISTIMPGDEIDLPLNFIFFKNKNSEWKIYDIHFDGKSILFSYKKQFQSIIKKRGISYLLKKLNEIVIKNK